MGMSTAGEGTRDKSHFIAIAVRGKSDKIAQTRQEISQVSRDLPPLNALRAFEVAARLESISRAADELHVTHGAVGRQIRILEETLGAALFSRQGRGLRSEEHTSELQSLMRISYAVFCLKKKKRYRKYNMKDDGGTTK